MTFSHTTSDGETLEMQTSSVVRDDILEAFRRFLLGVGFDLPGGARLGLEYDDECIDRVCNDAPPTDDSVTSVEESCTGDEAQVHVVQPEAVLDALDACPYTASALGMTSDRDSGEWMQKADFNILATAMKELAWLAWDMGGDNPYLSGTALAKRWDAAMNIAGKVEDEA